MTQQTGSQFKNVAVFLLSAAALVALMILGPFYLETCLNAPETAGTDNYFPPFALSRAPITMDTRDFGWTVSTQKFCATDFKNLTTSPESSTPSSQVDSLATSHKTLINLIVLADSTVK
jgi:hypothetical protein